MLERNSKKKIHFAITTDTHFSQLQLSQIQRAQFEQTFPPMHKNHWQKLHRPHEQLTDVDHHVLLSFMTYITSFPVYNIVYRKWVHLIKKIDTRVYRTWKIYFYKFKIHLLIYLYLKFFLIILIKNNVLNLHMNIFDCIYFICASLYM